MNRQENALMIFSEELTELISECLECQTIIAKTLRFGTESVRPGELITNIDRLNTEFNDVLGSVANLIDNGFPIIVDDKKIDYKLRKIKFYEKISKELGTLND